MKHHFRTAAAWNDKLLQSKFLKIYFNSLIFGGLVLAVFGGTFGIKIVLIGLGVLFCILGATQGYVAFGLISVKDYLNSILKAVIAGSLIAAGVSAVLAAVFKVNA